MHKTHCFLVKRKNTENMRSKRTRIVSSDLLTLVNLLTTLCQPPLTVRCCLCNLPSTHWLQLCSSSLSSMALKKLQMLKGLPSYIKKKNGKFKWREARNKNSSSIQTEFLSLFDKFLERLKLVMKFFYTINRYPSKFMSSVSI